MHELTYKSVVKGCFYAPNDTSNAFEVGLVAVMFEVSIAWSKGSHHIGIDSLSVVLHIWLLLLETMSISVHWHFFGSMSWIFCERSFAFRFTS